MPSHAAPESIKGRLLTCKAAYSGGTVPVLHRVSILSHKAPLTSLFNYHVLILALITNKVNNFFVKNFKRIKLIGQQSANILLMLRMSYPGSTGNLLKRYNQLAPESFIVFIVFIALKVSPL